MCVLRDLISPEGGVGKMSGGGQRCSWRAFRKCEVCVDAGFGQMAV